MKWYARKMDDKELLKFNSLDDVRNEFGSLHREAKKLYVKGRWYIGTRKSLKENGFELV